MRRHFQLFNKIFGRIAFLSQHHGRFLLFFWGLVCLGCLGNSGWSQKKPMSIQVIGHRGAAGLCPENTLAGFEKAVSLGVDAIELDVHLTKDKHVVVHHDSTLNAALTRDKEGAWLSPPTPAIKDLTYQQLQEYDVGRLNPKTLYAQKYPHQQPYDAARIPLLKDVLALTEKTRTPLYIELKTDPRAQSVSSDPRELVDAVLQVIREARAQKRVYVMSSDWRGPLYLQKTAPNLQTCFITEETQQGDDTILRTSSLPSPWLNGFKVSDFGGSIPHMIKAAKGNGWNVFYHNLTQEMIRHAKELGLKTVVWTPNSTHVLKKMIALGVDGITTDRPDLLLRLLGRSSRPS